MKQTFLFNRVGYVEFYDEESVPKALALTGQKLLGIPVIVQLTEAEKNRQARLAEQA
jgi:RNA-binding protein 39